MRAIEILERRRGTEAPEPRETCAAFVAALTSDERDELAAIIVQLKAFKEQIYVRRPDLRPAGYREPDDDPIVIPQPVECTRVEPVRIEPLTSPEPQDEPAPYSLSPALYSQVGLETLPTGEITHALGDEHAQNILNGTISLDDARAHHQASLHQLNRFDAKPSKPRRIS